MGGRSGWKMWMAAWLLGSSVALCNAAPVATPPRPLQLRAVPRLGRDRALDVLAYVRGVLKPEDMEKLDFDKSIGFLQGWEPRAAVLCIKDSELKFPGERAPIFLFVSALDLTDFEGAFGGLPRGVYVAVGSGGDDAISIYKFTQRNAPLRKVTTKRTDMSQESSAPRYFVQQAGKGGAFTLHMFVGKARYEWLLLEPKPAEKPATPPATPPAKPAPTSR